MEDGEVKRQIMIPLTMEELEHERDVKVRFFIIKNIILLIFNLIDSNMFRCNIGFGRSHRDSPTGL